MTIIHIRFLTIELDFPGAPNSLKKLAGLLAVNFWRRSRGRVQLEVSPLVAVPSSHTSLQYKLVRYHYICRPLVIPL